MSELAHRSAVYLQCGLWLGYELLSLVLPPRRARSAGGLGVEERVVALVGMRRVVVGHATVAVVESDPLDGLVLGTDVDGILLAGVCAGEDVSDVVDAVDLVKAGECVGAPDRDKSVAST